MEEVLCRKGCEVQVFELSKIFVFPYSSLPPIPTPLPVYTLKAQRQSYCQAHEHQSELNEALSTTAHQNLVAQPLSPFQDKAHNNFTDSSNQSHDEDDLRDATSYTPPL
jgi:hypothetical protein